MQECTLKVAGCEPIFQDGVCCPVKYMCGKDDFYAYIYMYTIDQGIH